MNNVFQQLKNFVSKNMLLAILSAAAFFSIMILFITISRASLDGSGTRTSENPVEGINTSAKYINELNLSADQSKALYDDIVSIVQMNSVKENIDISDIEIRKDSIKVKDFSETDLESGYINLIVDLPKYKQSYQAVLYTQKKDDDESTAKKKNMPNFVSCIYDSSKIKYKNFSCKDNYGTDQKYSILNYYAERSSVNDANLYLYEDTRELYIDITSYEGTDAEAISDAKKWVNSMGFSTEDIRFVPVFAEGAPPPEHPGGQPTSPAY